MSMKDMCKDHFWFEPKWKKMCSEMVKLVQTVGKKIQEIEKKNPKFADKKI